MTLHVTMHMFSGRSDPEWTLEGPDEQEFRRLIASSAADSARPIVPWRMGYRGFTVVDPAAPDQPIMRIQNRSITSFSFCNAPQIEEFLLRAGPEDLPFRPEDITLGAPTEPRVARAVTCPPSQAADAPAWDPALWAAYDARPSSNYGRSNCYNYATNRPAQGRDVRPNDYGFAYPGRISGSVPQFWGAAGALSGALSDGLIREAGPGVLAAGEGHHCCLVIWPFFDHHWYRQDDNGCWSHKLGGSPITNLDNSGQEMPDPRIADRSGYTLFVSFFAVPPTVEVL